jgi:hypothetical protein
MTPATLSALLSGDFDNAIIAATPGGIERQEKQGQLAQAALETLPIDGTDADERQQWESLGFVFREPYDDLFVSVEFPPGWSKQPTEHSMHTDILDDKGRRRGGIFYKAAFYDRKANCSLSPRFSYSLYGDGAKEGTYSACVKDSGKPFKSFGETYRKDHASREIVEDEIKTWLHKNYPDYQNPAAYWD